MAHVRYIVEDEGSTYGVGVDQKNKNGDECGNCCLQEANFESLE